MNNMEGGLVKKNIRKKEVEVLRIWFTIAVCMHHLRYCTEILPYGGGYIAVDFFFIVSGFYLRKYFVKKEESGKNSTFSYMKKRYIRLMKDYIPAFIVAMIINILVFDFDIMGNIFLYVKEGLMIELGCINSGLRMNPPDWYCGYLLISSGLVYIILKIVRKRVGIFSFCMSLIAYIWLGTMYGHINIFPLQSCIISWALLRAIAGQMAGIFLYELFNLFGMNKIFPRSKLKILFGVLLAFISYMLFWDMAYSLKDYLCVFLLGVLFYLSLMVDFRVLTYISPKMWNMLSELTYVIFLNHYIIVKLFGYFNVFHYGDWKIVSLFYIFIVFFFSILMLQLRKNLEKYLLKRRTK